MDWKDFIKDFLSESSETLAKLDEDFVILESEPGNRERLDEIYRGVHSIKGSAGFFAFSKLEAVAHAGENLLGELAEGALTATPEIITALLAMVDAIRDTMQTIADSGSEGEGDFSELLGTLKRLRSGETAGSTEVEPAVPVAATAPPPQEPAPAPAPEVPPAPAPAPAPEVPPPAPPEPHEEAAGALEVSLERLVESPVRKVDAAPDKIEDQAASADAKDVTATPSRRLGGADIRVSVDLLDKLMGLVGELVLSRNQVMQYAGFLEDRSWLAAFQQLDLITTELQQTVMKTRMQPIRNIFSKFPRVVRDLALSCGKKVRLELDGQETELDKSLLEAISSPLTHIVRNAVDHGIETPDSRLLSDKPEEGRLTLRAFHESGHVNIEISDDGRGIDVEKLRAKAVAQGLIVRDSATGLGENEVLDLMFLPGLSTADHVSNISGRGVGMDVVRANLEKIGGTIDIHTAPGEGSTFKVKIPLTLAIIPALIVSTRGQRFAIPQVSLREAVHLKGDSLTNFVETVHETPVYRLRGRLLPLVDLATELRMDARTLTGRLAGSHSVNIVVLNVDEQQFGLVVDQISDTQEIVVKPISSQLRLRGCFAGATIMDDGNPALILDVLKLAQRAKVLADAIGRPLLDARIDEEKAAAADREREVVLIFESPDGGRMAMPVASVGRLEIIPRSRVEAAGDQQVIQYRDQILPLVQVFDYLPGGENTPPVASTEGALHVVVYDYEGRAVGLVVGRILDIVEEVISVKGVTSREGVLGTAVIRGRVTELVDTDSIVRRSLPAFDDPTM